MKDSSNYKDFVFTRFRNVLKGQAMFAKDSMIATDEERLLVMNIVEDMMLFLNNYEEARQVLNDYYARKKKETEIEER